MCSSGPAQLPSEAPQLVLIVVKINTSDLIVFRLFVAGCMIFAYVQLPGKIKFKVMYLF